MTGRQMLLYCLTLVPVSLLPVLFHQAGLLYAAGALGLGLIFLRAVLGFCGEKSTARARKVLHVSLIYLPLLLALLLLEIALRHQKKPPLIGHHAKSGKATLP